MKSFTEIGPILLQPADVKYLLSEVFNQGGKVFFYTTTPWGIRVRKPNSQEISGEYSYNNIVFTTYKDLKTLNVEAPSTPTDLLTASQPLPKHKRCTQTLHDSLIMIVFCLVHYYTT